MHRISKLVLWITTINLLLRGIVFGGSGIALYMVQKMPVPNDIMPFNKDDLFKMCFMLLLLMIVDIICGAYVLHGKPSRDAKYAPIMTLCVACLTTFVMWIG